VVVVIVVVDVVLDAAVLALDVVKVLAAEELGDVDCAWEEDDNVLLTTGDAVGEEELETECEMDDVRGLVVVEGLETALEDDVADSAC
jgi:hypothetical protein